jgi:Tol biopolymer transport system component
VWVDRGGAEEPAAISERPVAQPRLSPDGHRVAVVAKGDPDVWQVDLTRGAWTRLTFDGSSSFPLWTSDGRHLTFSSGKAGPYTMYWRMTDGSGAEERLLAAARSSYPLSWSTDGRLLAFVSVDSQTAQDIWLLDAAPGAGPRRCGASLSAHTTPDPRQIAEYPGSGPPRFASALAPVTALSARRHEPLTPGSCVAGRARPAGCGRDDVRPNG